MPAPRAAAVAFKGAPGEFAKRELPAFTKRSRETTCGIIPQMLRNISALASQRARFLLSRCFA